jgi:DNA-binding PadR family transcriptional regulator
MYELTPAGRDLLRAWVKALKQTQVVVNAFLERFEGR